MTIDEAIMHAREVAGRCNETECAKEHGQLAEWLEELKELREKQTPKKVVYKKTRYGTPYYCPTCDVAVDQVYFLTENGNKPKKQVSYCWICGQAINWEGAENDK